VIGRKRGQGTILVAEDEILTRAMLAQFLRAAGHVVIEASSADDAAAVLHSGLQIDLAITDLEMPGDLDGEDLVRLLHVDFPGIPVIIAAGPPRDPAIRQRVDALVEKPYDVTVVVNLATRLLARGHGNGNETHTETA
jgi:CheY-like chemotaxis protein